MHYPANEIQGAPSAIMLSMIMAHIIQLKQVYHPPKNHMAF